MPVFSRSVHNSNRKTIHVKLEAPNGKTFEADVFADEVIGDLAKEFYDFLNVNEDVRQTRVYWIDPATMSILSILDNTATLKGAGIHDEVQLRFVTSQDHFGIEVTTEKNLQIFMPFPKNLPAIRFAGYVNDFLTASDFIYSFFAVLLSENQQSITALKRMLAEEPKRLVEPKVLHQILKINGDGPLELVRIHYGSPYSLTLDGLWKPLEMLGDVIKGVRWKWDYEEQVAELDLKERHLKIAQTQLDIAVQIAKLDISQEDKSSLLKLMLPGVTRLNSVIEVSKAESAQQQRPFIEERPRHSPHKDEKHSPSL